MSLFGKKIINIEEIENYLKQVENSRHKKRLELRKISRKQGRLFDKIKKAHKNGNSFEVDYIWKELQQLTIEARYYQKELKSLNLKQLVLKKYSKILQTQSESKERELLHQLVIGIKKSGIEKKWERHQLVTEEYLEELQGFLEESELEEDYEPVDVKKADFLNKLDNVLQMEAKGNSAQAVAEAKRLKQDVSVPEFGNTELDNL